MQMQRERSDRNTEGVQQAKEIQDPMDRELTIGSGPMTRERLKRMQEVIQAQSNLVFANGIKSQSEAQHVSLISLIQAQGSPQSEPNSSKCSHVVKRDLSTTFKVHLYTNSRIHMVMHGFYSVMTKNA